jgi:hypothetical protein
MWWNQDSLLNHDNAPAHNVSLSEAFLASENVVLFLHFAESPYLFSCYMLPRMKSDMLGPRCLYVPTKHSQPPTRVSGWKKRDTTVRVYRLLRPLLEETESSSLLRYNSSVNRIVHHFQPAGTLVISLVRSCL